MKEKQEQICENCGHLESFHLDKGCVFVISEKTKLYKKQNCPCKKFTPKNHSSRLRNFDTPSGKTDNKSVIISPEGVQNQEKGCGNDFRHRGFIWKCGRNYHGEIKLCPTCQEKDNKRK